MKLVYVHQYFTTPEQGGAVRSYHLAKGLVDSGVQVEVITAHNHTKYVIRWIDGIRVHFLPVSYRNGFLFLRRVFSFLRFVWLARKVLEKTDRPDLLYVTSTPLTTGLLGLWAKKAKRIPYVFEVRDQWPEAPIQLGVIKNPVLKGLLYRFEKYVYDESQHVVALSPSIRDSVAQISPFSRVSCIPNFSDTAFFKANGGAGLSQENEGSERPVTISYLGAIGRVNGLETYLDLAEAAQYAGKSWQFVLMGEGAALPKLQQVGKEKGLRNLVFLPFGNKVAVREQLRRSDFAYISFLPLPVLESSSPNKFFDAIAMGLPVILNFIGWLCDLVLKHEIGIYQGSDVHTTIREMERFLENPAARLGVRARARALAEMEFSKDKAVEELRRLVFDLTVSGKAPSEVCNLTA